MEKRERRRSLALGTTEQKAKAGALVSVWAKARIAVARGPSG